MAELGIIRQQGRVAALLVMIDRVQTSIGRHLLVLAPDLSSSASTKLMCSQLSGDV